MSNVFYFIFVCISEIVWTNGQNPISPCPYVFRYESNGWETTGLLTIVSQITKIKVDVTLSVGSHNLNSNGRFEPLETTWNAACEALEYNGLRLRLHFPTQNPLPLIEEIKFNGNLICAGSKASGSFITTLNLSYDLNLNCPNFPSTSVPSWGSENTSPVWIPPTTRIPYKPTSPPDWNPYWIETQRPETTRATPPPTRRPTTSPPEIQKKKLTTIFGNDEDCGRTSRVLYAIIEGKVAKSNYPWLTQIYYNNKFICGGNLVSNQHVVTAAHCITEVPGPQNSKNFELVFGVHKFNDSLGPHTESVEAMRIFVHPLFVSADLSLANYDIAIVITKPVKFTARIKPICLFRSLSDISSLSNKIGIIAGWGTTEKEGLSGVLKETRVQIVSHEQCKESDYQFRDIVKDRNFCAGGINGSGPCTGDSGGGLFFEFIHQNVRRYYLRGIISLSLAVEDIYNKQICAVDKYAVYTDVAKYENWFLEFVE